MASNSLSTTKGSTSLSYPTPIRAPITADDDSTDFESLTESVYSETSSNGSEFEYVSGEEFDTASEKPFVDEENPEESRPFLPSVKYELSMPFVHDPDEESLGNSVTDEEESGVQLSGPNSQLGMPIAQLSIEEDGLDELIGDDSNGEEENSSFRAIARVDSAPRVRVSDVEEDSKDDEFLLPSDELEVNDSVVNESVSVAGSGELKEGILKENAGGLEHVFDDSVSVNVVNESVSVSELGELKDGILKENAGGLKHVFDDSFSVNVVKPKVYIESLLEKKDDVLKQNFVDDFKTLVEERDLGLESSELIRGDDLDSESLEIDCAGKEQIGETVNDFVDSHESELTQVHNILAELPELKVDSFNNVSEAAIDPVYDSVERIVSEPGMEEEATSFIDGSVDLEEDDDSESLEDKPTQEQSGMIYESIPVADAISVDSMENADLLEVPEKDLIFNPEKTAALQGSFLSDADIENMIFGDSEAAANFMNELEKSSSDSPVVDDGEIVSNAGSDKEHEDNNSSSEEDKELIEKIHNIRVKFLRLVYRLGLSPEDPIVAQVLYRLVLAVEGHVSEKFSFDSAKETALQLEAGAEKVDLDFSLSILVIGKTGVGKSATINSIFGEKKVAVNAFEQATSTVKEVVGMVNGVRIRVFDTPGLREEAANRKILASIKRLTKKFPPDVVLYVDRLDSYTRDSSDLPLLGSVTSSLTESIWRNAIVTLTHAAVVPPDGPYGATLRFEAFVAQRSHIVQQAISRAVGNIHLMGSSMMHPVALVENHPSCRKNEKGENVLSNGQTWRPQLLLLCYSLKILSEANSITNPREENLKNRLGLESLLRSLPVPHLLSSMLQSRKHLKQLQGGVDVDSDVELLDFSGFGEEDEDEFDQLPPFKPLTKSEVDKLSKEHRKAYFEEYDYRVNLLQKKQLKEEVKRLKKKPEDSWGNLNQEEEEEGPATVPVAMPDFSLPLSFDSDNPSYRYRALEPTSQLLVRPVLDSQGWDHDFGYDGVNIEQNLAIADAFPGALSVQITKDKKDFNFHLDSSICAKHGKNGSTMAGFDIQNMGRQLAYILRTETQFKNFKLNKTTGGLCLTLAGKNVATGLKLEEQIAFGKQLAITGSAGAVRSKGETALGANFEIRLKSKDYPLKQDKSTLGLSMMKWRGEPSLMANLQSEFSIGRNSRMTIGVGMNNNQSGKISIKTSSSELQIAAVCIFPILASIVRTLSSGSAAKHSNLLD